MAKAETLDNPVLIDKGNHIPTALAVIGGIPIVLNGLWIALSSLAFLGIIFGRSPVLGFIVLLTPLGWILGAATVIAFTSFSWFGELRSDISRFEYWTKVVLIFLGALIAPWIIYYIVVFFEGFVLNFLYSYFGK